MSVKKLSFYLDSARITVCSDHLPLKRFLVKNTLNAKVNNWAVELKSQKIDFVFIQGTKNVLADTLSRLIEIDDDIKLHQKYTQPSASYTWMQQTCPARWQITTTTWLSSKQRSAHLISLKLVHPSHCHWQQWRLWIQPSPVLLTSTALGSMTTCQIQVNYLATNLPSSWKP